MFPLDMPVRLSSKLLLSKCGQRPGFKSLLHHLLSVDPWASYSLNLRVHIYKLEIRETSFGT